MPYNAWKAWGSTPLRKWWRLLKTPHCQSPCASRQGSTCASSPIPGLPPVVPHENVSVRLEELGRSWDIATLEEFNRAFQKELDTLPDEAKAGLKKLEAMGRIGPIIMQALLKFVEMRHEQAQASEEGGLIKVVKM
jgi:hypothetical protein